jgi:uncharacterized delta-60 repeat protein
MNNASTTGSARKPPPLRAFVCSLALLVSANATAQVAVSGQAGARDFDFGELTASGQSGVFAFSATTTTNAMGVLVQSSGHPVVIGSCGANPAEDICISRLNRDGWQIDTSFGTAGTARYNSGGQDYGYASMLDSSDRIVVGGVCGGVSPSACVLRFTASGQPDSSFGTGGRSGLPGMLRIATLAIDADGRIVAGGECFQGNDVACIGRLTASGAVDSTFNGGTPLNIGFPTATYSATSHLTFDASGRILVSAYCSSSFSGNSYGRFCAARLTPAGVLDPTFNGGVPRLYALNTATTFCSSSSIAENASGQILVAGYCTSSAGANRFAVSRLTSNGSFDLTFGVDNYAGLSFQWVDSDLYVGGTRMHVDDRQRIVLSGYCQIGFCLARMLASGQPDPLFGDRGVVLYKPEPSFSGFEQYAASSLVFDRNRILLGGSCARSSTDRRACVTRHYLDDPPGERCSLDLDGDGEILAATDGLLWARALLGIRGTALVANAIGSRAQRTSAAALDAHLSTHCGIR